MNHHVSIVSGGNLIGDMISMEHFLELCVAQTQVRKSRKILVVMVLKYILANKGK